MSDKWLEDYERHRKALQREIDAAGSVKKFYQSGQHMGRKRKVVIATDAEAREAMEWTLKNHGEALRRLDD